MKIIMLETKNIILADYNPRSISEHALNGLTKSMELFGLQQPLIVNKRNGVLVSGHQRHTVATRLGIQKVPVVYVDLDEAQEKAFNITLNNKSIEGNFTDDVKNIINDINEALGADFIFDLNIEDILTDLNKITDIVDDDEEFEPDIKEKKESVKKNVLIIDFDDVESLETAFLYLNSCDYKVRRG